MYHDDFYILHLSDLHIQNESEDEPHYSESLRELINDIADQTKEMDKLIIVISGDIINEGIYEDEKTVIKFFKRLYEKINEKNENKVIDIIDVIITPGNHDKYRTPINSLVSYAHAKNEIGGLRKSPQKNDAKAKAMAKEEWDHQLESYKGFLSLANEIRDIFVKKERIDNTFGVNIVEIAEKNSICFLRVDTSWCTYEKNAYRRQLRVGEYQLEELNRKYREKLVECRKTAKPIKLTIALSHHPLNLLSYEEEELCYKYFLSNKNLNVDILMCGHIHDRGVKNYFDYNHSLLTLITGIKTDHNSPDTNSSSNTRLCYSLYSINLLRNSCEIIMRKENARGDGFSYDYSAYDAESHDVAIKEGKLRYPLKTKGNGSFIDIGAVYSNENKGLFVNNEIIKKLPKVANAITSFSKEMACLHRVYKKIILKGDEKKSHDFFLDNEPLEKEYLSDDVEYINASFISFLHEICTVIVQKLESCFEEKKSPQMRAHFRYCNKKGDQYLALCQYGNCKLEKAGISTADWDSLIKYSFEENKPLVLSANKKYSNIKSKYKKTKWEDNITLTPHYNDASYDIGLKDARPFLSFCLSMKNMKCDEDRLVLYLLAYLEIHDVIANVIDEYRRIFHIDVKRILNRIHDIQSNEKDRLIVPPETTEKNNNGTVSVDRITLNSKLAEYEIKLKEEDKNSTKCPDWIDKVKDILTKMGRTENKSEYKLETEISVNDIEDIFHPKKTEADTKRRKPSVGAKKRTGERK